MKEKKEAMWTKWKKTLLAVALHLLGLRHHLLLLHLIVHQVFYMGASYAKLFGKELAEVFSFLSQPPILQYPTHQSVHQRVGYKSKGNFFFFSFQS